MAHTFTENLGLNVDGVQVYNVNIAVTDDLTKRSSGALAPLTTDQPVAIAFDNTDLMYSSLESDQDIEVYTNAIHSGSFQDHFSLKAGVAQVWTSKGGTTSPYAGNVTIFYLTNASATLTANYSIDILEHSD